MRQRNGQRNKNVIHWPYRPWPTALPDIVLLHSGGSALAWVRLAGDTVSVTSADPELIATSRLLIEQREADTA